VSTTPRSLKSHPPPPPVVFDLTVSGMVRGEDLMGTASLELAERAILLHLGVGTAEDTGRTLAIPFVSLDGIEAGPDSVLIYLSTGDVIELSESAQLGTLALAIAERACALPELTRPLRALGSRRGRPGADHDRFFAPLIDARRAVEKATRIDERLVAFEAETLRKAVDDVLRGMAAERFPQSAPDRRALSAELLELAERLYASLDVVRERAAAVRASSADAKFAHWRRWSHSVAAVFEQADRCWMATLRALSAVGAAPPPRRPWLRWGRG
jgi:hypothetical protein